MEETGLRHPLLAVKNRHTCSYGGSQSFSENPVVKGCGCGIVAACEVFYYLHSYLRGCNCPLFAGIYPQEPLESEKYSALLERLRCYFPLIPRFGINGPMLSLGMNAFFRKYAYPYRASWCMSGELMLPRVRYMLERDIPVIISVGPNLPLFWQKHKTGLYRRFGEDKYTKATSVNSHFMILTALDSQWMTVSSWGRKYYISLTEYEDYAKKHSSSLVSNIIYIERK